MPLHVDPAALVAAAVRAAILAKAPRRTVAAVAAATAGAFAPRQAAPQPQQTSRVPTGAGAATQAPGSSPEELVHALREARQAQRRRKKERRTANRRARAGEAAGPTVEDAELRVGNSASLQKANCETEDSAMTPRAKGGAGPSAALSNSPVLERPWKAPRAGIDADSNASAPLGMVVRDNGSLSVDSAFGADRHHDYSSVGSAPHDLDNQLAIAEPVVGASGNNTDCSVKRRRRRGKRK